MTETVFLNIRTISRSLQLYVVICFANLSNPCQENFIFANILPSTIQTALQEIVQVLTKFLQISTNTTKPLIQLTLNKLFIFGDFYRFYQSF